MGGQFGTANIQKALDFIVELANVGDAMVQTPGSILEKATKAAALFDELLALTGLSMVELKKELGELDAGDKANVVSAFKQKFNISDDVAEARIESGLDLLIEGETFVRKVIAFGILIKS